MMSSNGNGNGSNRGPVSRIFSAPVRIFVPRQNLRSGPVVRTFTLGPSVSQSQVRARHRPLLVVQPAPPRFGLHHFRRFHHFHGGFGLPFCSSVFGTGFATHHFGIFGRELTCFPHPFVNPFFFPFAPLASSTVLLLPLSAAYAQTPYTAEQQYVEQAPPVKSDAAPAEVLPSEEATQPAKKEAGPITLLQLKDGSMYALTDYWLENGRLHYITSYGGENDLPMERIDLDTTVKLNYERDVEFVLRPKPARR